VAAPHSGQLDVFDHLDAVGGERVADRGGDLGLLAAR
jgi:hypothetical protein